MKAANEDEEDDDEEEEDDDDDEVDERKPSRGTVPNNGEKVQLTTCVTDLS